MTVVADHLYRPQDASGVRPGLVVRLQDNPA